VDDDDYCCDDDEEEEVVDKDGVDDAGSTDGNNEKSGDGEVVDGGDGDQAEDVEDPVLPDEEKILFGCCLLSAVS